jgi:hypothetical protein
MIPTEVTIRLVHFISSSSVEFDQNVLINIGYET